MDNLFIHIEGGTIMQNETTDRLNDSIKTMIAVNRLCKNHDKQLSKNQEKIQDDLKQLDQTIVLIQHRTRLNTQKIEEAKLGTKFTDSNFDKMWSLIDEILVEADNILSNAHPE
jgi:hypothetical protein